MKVSKWKQVFGKAGSPNVQVPLPITIADGQFFSPREPSSERDMLTKFKPAVNTLSRLILMAHLCLLNGMTSGQTQ